ncbi:hypothetical protein, partial [Klebsiella pneumoniae]|uniref:hypothetical protein n=1 Tax=Klebsiella pneumoniae TaxID=573 RepID=UPI003B5AB9FA
ACVLPENPASYRVVRTKSYLFNKAAKNANIRVEGTFCFFRGGSAGVVLSPYPLPWHTIHIKVTDVSEDI